MQHLAESDETGILYEPLMVAEPSNAAGILRVTAPADQKLIAEVETWSLSACIGALMPQQSWSMITLLSVLMECRSPAYGNPDSVSEAFPTRSQICRSKRCWF